jgi:DNA-binding NtrC family response regulator
LLESELFGHKKGSFTGAMEDKKGLFEVADGGTIFLDEIGELSPSVQVKLLRVLEERAVQRIGERAPRPVDVRFVAATNRDLEEEIERGAFRRDLYYRLSGAELTVPPLRERRLEILPLASFFLAEACRKIERTRVPKISPEAASRLEQHAFRGNVRELRNAMDRAAVLCAGDIVLPEHLPPKIAGDKKQAPPPRDTAPGVSPGTMPTLQVAPQDVAVADKKNKAEERRRILDVLEQCAGNQTRAAEILGISRRTLVSRLEEYDLPRPRKRG